MTFDDFRKMFHVELVQDESLGGTHVFRMRIASYDTVTMSVDNEHNLKLWYETLFEDE